MLLKYLQDDIDKTELASVQKLVFSFVQVHISFKFSFDTNFLILGILEEKTEHVLITARIQHS
jgi:hypothetical protein